MKYKKTIIIKNPRLRRLRNSLRMILVKAVEKEWEFISKEWNLIFYWQDGTPRQPTIQEEAQAKYFHKKRSELLQAINASICKCATCGVADKDMTYNPVMKEWFCVDCYQENQKFYLEQGEPFLFP